MSCSDINLHLEEFNFTLQCTVKRLNVSYTANDSKIELRMPFTFFQ